MLRTFYTITAIGFLVISPVVIAGLIDGDATDRIHSNDGSGKSGSDTAGASESAGLETPGSTDTDTATAEDSDTEEALDENPWKNRRVLHIGDSHLANWGIRSTLKEKFRSAGARYQAVPWIGSNSRGWLVTGKLRKLLRAKSPNIVLINLGTNAFKYKNPKVYAKWITRVVKKIQPRKCYWISPPPFFEDKHGFYDILKEASIPCTFVDSRKAQLDITVDEKHFHLSKEQSARWAEMIWEDINMPPEEPAVQTPDIAFSDEPAANSADNTENNGV